MNGFAASGCHAPETIILPVGLPFQENEYGNRIGDDIIGWKAK